MGLVKSKCFSAKKYIDNNDHDDNVIIPDSISSEISSKIENFKESLNTDVSIELLKSEINNLKSDILNILGDFCSKMKTNIDEVSNRVSIELNEKRISYDAISQENRILREENDKIKYDYAMLISGSYSNQGKNNENF